MKNDYLNISRDFNQFTNFINDEINYVKRNSI